jgi:hypothetical protein
MSNDTITPRDDKETSILAFSAKVAGAMTILATLITGLLASDEKTKWITDNIPLLVSGVSTLVGGGIVAGIAVRRMKVDKAAKALSILLCMALAMILQGCVGTTVEIPVQGTIVKIKRIAFCNAVEIPKVSYVPATGEIQIEGYKSDGGALALKKGFELGTKAAAMGMKGATGL